MRIRYNRQSILDNNLGVIYVLLLLLLIFTFILKGTLALIGSLFIGSMLFISIILTIFDRRKKDVLTWNDNFFEINNSFFKKIKIEFSTVKRILIVKKKEVDSVPRDLPNSYEIFVELHIFDKKLNRQIFTLGDERYINETDTEAFLTYCKLKDIDIS
ncbi:hypothetical protein LL14B4_13080 (plasmid) [Lactococcus lactis subsp. lactis]|uniref:Uncharacterized protein n=1 Tax=Lactococcus lactis subsp. lactis TaxID=1360 RepID=A0A2Z3KK71_LACLL|nr:hypothetical protein [Lactococcus lactis]AWN67131.1 hypothetical protein LL14B4_13080 [Lactococcus lactis subsp. lactis]